MFINFIKAIFDAVNKAKKKEADQISQTFKNAQNARAKKLLEILEIAVALPQYQKGYPNERKYANGQLVTYCNVLARDVLDSRCPKAWIMGWLIGGANSSVEGYDYDISFMNPGKDLMTIILGTGIDVVYNNLLKAAEIGAVKSLTPEEAQNRANDGTPVHIISLKYGHEAIVCPSALPYNTAVGPMVAQAGFYNGIFPISDRKSWGTWWTDLEIKYYEYALVS